MEEIGPDHNRQHKLGQGFDSSLHEEDEMSSRDWAHGLDVSRIDDTQRDPVGRPVLADRVVVERGRASATMHDSAGDSELVRRSPVGAARRDPPS
jgi:hypothetical protein